jgi:hypothetical protein
VKKAKGLVKTSAPVRPEVDLPALPTSPSPEDAEQVYEDNDVIAASPIATPGRYIDLGPTKESEAPESSQLSPSSINLSANLTLDGSGAMEGRAMNDSNTLLYISMDSVFQPSASQVSTLGLPSGPILQENEEENEFEVIFLIRHFTEVVGTWLVYSPAIKGDSWLISLGWTYSTLATILLSTSP